MDDAGQSFLFEARAQLSVKLLDALAGGDLFALALASLGHLVRDPSRHAQARHSRLGAHPGEVGVGHADGDVFHDTKIVSHELRVKAQGQGAAGAAA